MFSIDSRHLLHGKVQNYVSSKKLSSLCIHQLQRQIGRSTVFWRKIKPIRVCYENNIMHYQNPIFLTQLRNNGIIPVQDEPVRCNDTDQFQCTAAIDNMVVDLQKGPESSTMAHVVLASWRASAMSECHSCSTNLGFADVHLKA